jgi:hypothetical protein
MCTINPVAGSLLIDVSFWVRQFFAFRQSFFEYREYGFIEENRTQDDIKAHFFRYLAYSILRLIRHVGVPLKKWQRGLMRASHLQCYGNTAKGLC